MRVRFFFFLPHLHSSYLNNFSFKSLIPNSSLIFMASINGSSHLLKHKHVSSYWACKFSYYSTPRKVIHFLQISWCWCNSLLRFCATSDRHRFQIYIRHSFCLPLVQEGLQYLEKSIHYHSHSSQWQFFGWCTWLCLIMGS